MSEQHRRPERQASRISSRVGAVVGLVVAVGVVVYGVVATVSSSAGAAPAVAVSVPATPATLPSLASSPSTTKYLPALPDPLPDAFVEPAGSTTAVKSVVGVDIRPGLYKAPGGPTCQWSRDDTHWSRDTSGHLTNNGTMAFRQGTIWTLGCGVWAWVGP